MTARSAGDDAPSSRSVPWAELRAALDAVGFRPKKTLGQNLLVDGNAARSIALDAQVGPGDRVLEVGTGAGALTRHLVDLEVELVAVEIDARLLELARSRIGDRGHVRWLCADVLAGKHALAPAVRALLPAAGAWHVVSNLPYSIAAPLLAVLARLENPPASMTVLVQAEVAERIAASPGGSSWGALPARLALRYRRGLGREVGAQLFWPRPRVASRVARLDLDPVPGLTAVDLGAYDRLVEGLFQRRRKQLLSALTGVLGSREAAAGAIARTDLDPRMRPEELDPALLLGLARNLETSVRGPKTGQV